MRLRFCTVQEGESWEKIKSIYVILSEAALPPGILYIYITLIEITKPFCGTSAYRAVRAISRVFLFLAYLWYFHVYACQPQNKEERLHAIIQMCIDVASRMLLPPPDENWKQHKSNL